MHAPARVDVDQLLAAAAPRAGAVRFIAIDGHGASGKSTLAELLHRRLGAEVVHTDDFASWEDELDWWPLVIERVFAPVAAGAATLSYERSSWWPDHHPDPVVAQPVTDPMILEGVSALRREFRPYVSLAIFVQASAGLCLARGIAKDRATGTPEPELERMWRGWLAREDAYFARDRPADHADVVLDGSRPFQSQLK